VELARLGAERQADMLQQARELLITLRRVPEIAAPDPGDCRATVKVIAADHPQFYSIGVVDPDGMLRCHSAVTERRPRRKAAEDAVRASETLLRGVFERTPDCILVTSVASNATLMLQTYNPAAASVIGCSAGDMRGKPLRHVLSSPEAGKIMDNLDRCRATGQVIELEDVALLGKGQRKWDLTLAPIFDEQTRVTQIIITARETTEKKLVANLVRESWERYRLIADNVADLVVRLG
jgi:PAS domain S-box-containing protein